MFQRFLLRKLPLQDLSPFVCGVRDCAPGWQIGPNIRDHWVLHYVLSGKGTFLCNGEAFPAQAGELFIVHPGERTFYIADGHDPWSYIWAGLTCSESLAQLIAPPVIKAPWAASCFSRMIASQEKTAPEWAVCSLLYEFFATLAAQQEAGRVPSPEDYVNRAITGIQANYDQPLQISEIAASLGLNRSYFCRLFKQHTGMSPQAYLVSYRLEKAAEMITVQGMSQKEAAQLTGYADPASFCRMFKRKFGVPPGAYRNAFRQED